jgi:hypothetical protein
VTRSLSEATYHRSHDKTLRAAQASYTSCYEYLTGGVRQRWASEQAGGAAGTAVDMALFPLDTLKTR